MALHEVIVQNTLVRLSLAILTIQQELPQVRIVEPGEGMDRFGYGWDPRQESQAAERHQNNLWAVALEQL